MKRLALITLAPVLAAVLLVATGVYRPGSGPAVAASVPAEETPVAGAPADVAGGTLVLGGRANDLAVGLAVRRASVDTVALEASVLDPDGTGARGLAVVFASASDSAEAAPCGQGRYCATLAASVPGKLEVQIDGTAARFELPASWEPAGELVARATRVYEELRTVAFEERLSPGSGKAIQSRWDVVAPDRLAYRIAGGPAARVVGNRRWDREPGGPWVESEQTPLDLPKPPWTKAVANPSLLGSTTIDGRQAWIVSFLDRAALPTWFTLWIDKSSFRTLELQMTTSAHFMRQRYLSFDEPLTVEPPR